MIERLRYPKVAPEGFAALTAFGHYLNTATAIHPVLKALVELRVSQINGCSFCIGVHENELRKHNEPATRISALSDWRSSTAFTAHERAALQWAEVLTNVTLGSHANDDDYAEIAIYFKDRDLADLTYIIANINANNRLSIAFRPRFHEASRQEEAL